MEKDLREKIYNINAQLEGADVEEPVGYQEVCGDDPSPAPIILSAEIIDRAYRAYAEALQERLEADVKKIEEEPPMPGYKSQKEAQIVGLRAEYAVQQAKNEVDRVTALQNWFQTEAIFKTKEM